MSRWRLTLLALASALVSLPEEGHAAVIRTVCISGCVYTTLGAAITASSAGDGIEVMPGTYNEQVVVDKTLTISGAPGGPRPVIANSAGGPTLEVTPGGAETTIRHLDIRALGEPASVRSALVATGAVTASDLALSAPEQCASLAVTASDLALSAPEQCASLRAPTPSRLGPNVTASALSGSLYCVGAGFIAADVVTDVTVNAPQEVGVVLAGAATLTDSTVTARQALGMSGAIARRLTLNGDTVGVRVSSYPRPAVISDSVVTAGNGVAVLVPSTGGLGSAVTLRNITAIGTVNGIQADVDSGGIDARNVIARGDAHDVAGSPATSSGCGGPCPAGPVTIGYSNFTTTDGPVDTTSVGHNQIGNPLLINPVLGWSQDFHIASANSPLIKAGTQDASDGPSDRDGVPHSDPPTIGAYEYTGPSAPPSGNAPPAASPGGGGTASTPGSGSRRPTISGLAETNTVFAVALTSTPLRGRTAAAPPRRGTTFSFGLDQAATVTIVIRGSAKCPRTTIGTRRNLPCARTVARLTRSAHAGLSRLRFSGRIRGKPLKPADYDAVFAATSAGGTSDPRTLHFRIVRR
jgi:hypothetical protein